MRVDLEPPPGYQPLPPDVSETTAKFRWPVANPRKPYSPPKGQISVDGPLQSPAPKPRLRYHRQSSYTDAYVTFPSVVDRASKPVSEWTTPIRKQGEFIGESVYEKTFEWPSDTVQAERFPPLISTVGLGILPILGTKGKKPQLNTSFKTTHNDAIPDKGVKSSTSSVGSSSAEPSYWVLNCNPHKPVERIWDEQTTHRIDYTIPPKILRPIKEPAPPADESNFQFIGTGKMETTTISMRDCLQETENPINNGLLSRRNTFAADVKRQKCPCYEADIKSNYSETDCLPN